MESINKNRTGTTSTMTKYQIYLLSIGRGCSVLPENPIQINADLMIAKALAGLKDGLHDKIYPEVKLCLSFLCCLRSNDLNPKFVRGNGQAPKLGVTHEWLDDYDGSFMMLPSKQKDGTNYKAFSNVTIVKHFVSLV